MNIILSGQPGVGKSTILKKVLILLENKNPHGCIVEEIRENSERIGFQMKYFPTGIPTLLASTRTVLSDHKVSKYFVNLKSIDEELVPFMLEIKNKPKCGIVIFDEIGRMQNLSKNFITAVDSIMNLSQPLIATIVYEDEPWTMKYKNDPKNFFIVATENNRDFIPNIIKLIVNADDLYNKLSINECKMIICLFNKYIKNNQLHEIKKLFEHAILYVAEKRYKVTSTGFEVIGNHGISTVTIRDEQYFCSCAFHAQNKRECSHIQTIKLTKNHLDL